MGLCRPNTSVYVKDVEWYIMYCYMLCGVEQGFSNNPHTYRSSAALLLDFRISLRLLALILCSNCSNTFNKVLTIIDGHLLNYFLKIGQSLELAQNCPRMVTAFHTPP